MNRPLKISETVARDIVRHITDDQLQPGDLLPSEAAMVEEYGVSRESLREGLRLLEVQGLITLRRGPHGGPMVATVDPANLGRISTLFYHLVGGTYRELFEAWVLFEVILAERAARHPDAAARLAAMGPYIDPPEARNGELDDFVDARIAFHAAVASLDRNRVIGFNLQTVGHIVTHHIAVAGDPRLASQFIDDDHRLLARAIIAGQPTRARTLMEQHIENVAQFAIEQLGLQTSTFIEWQ